MENAAAVGVAALQLDVRRDVGYFLAERQPESSHWGGWLYVGATAQAHLHGVTVQRCKARGGGGMCLEGIVSLVDIGIEDCSATVDNSAMYVRGAGSLRADRRLFGALELELRLVSKRVPLVLGQLARAPCSRFVHLL